MQIKKIIVLDDNNDEHEFNIVEGCGIFITDNNQHLVLTTEKDEINMKLMRLILGGKC